MRIVTPGFFVVVSVAMAAASPYAAAAATLNECKMPDGSTVLLWEKCPEGDTRTPPAAVAPRAPPRETSSAPATAPNAPPKARSEAPRAPPAAEGPFAMPPGKANELDREMVVEITSGYTVCSDDVDGFRPKYSAAYDFWRLRNSAAIARAQADPKTRREIAERIAEGRSASGGTDVEKRNYCEKLIGPFLTGKFTGTGATSP
jgi:hypothetical protein